MLLKLVQFLQGANVIATPDQNATDFTKALKLTIDYITKDNLQVGIVNL